MDECSKENSVKNDNQCRTAINGFDKKQGASSKKLFFLKQPEINFVENQANPQPEKPNSPIAIRPAHEESTIFS